MEITPRLRTMIAHRESASRLRAAAIAEGATIVRVGTAIYGARDYSKKA